MSYVAHIREWVKTAEIQVKTRFRVLSEQVVYSGIHAGDWIGPSDAQLMIQELNTLETMAKDEYHREFVQTMKQLCDACVASGNPIVF